MKWIPFLFLPAFFSLAFAAPDKPNIVFINADDLTHSDLSVYGGQAKTPNFDRLAGEGMVFRQCFQAAPMCSPTRHNLYTGIYPVKTGAYPNHTFAKEGTKSIVHYLQPHGYRVALSGKRHISPESVFPFEYSGQKNPDMEAIEKLMAESKEADTPFCLFACSNEPHEPWNLGDATQYPPKEIKLPPYFIDTPATRQGMSKYLAEVTYYDGQVGQILDLLDKYSLTENTIVMVSSEQGNSLPFAKWTLYDPGLQTALLVRWPGKVAEGSSTDAMVEYTDVVPTLLDAVDIEIPDGLDGKSFLPVLAGEATEHKEYVYGIMTTRGINFGSENFGIRSIRSKTHQLIVNFTPEVKFTNACSKSEEFQSWVRRAESGKKRAAKFVERYHYRPPVELYEVGNGWHKWNNLADSADHSEILRDLQGRLDSWMKEQGDLGQETEMAALEHQSRGKKKKGKKK
ncbi:MAG: sulfatase atsG [Verrucomicrobiales bacterium]|nr:sulfatase atsG [Verrucomicrobiales bacterium]